LYEGEFAINEVVAGVGFIGALIVAEAYVWEAAEVGKGGGCVGPAECDDFYGEGGMLAEDMYDFSLIDY